MDTKSLEASFRMKPREPDLGVLAERFDFAFRESKDLHAAMAAVNELLARPITYQQLFSALRR